MSCVVRFECGKTNTNNSVDAAVNHFWWHHNMVPLCAQSHVRVSAKREHARIGAWVRRAGGAKAGEWLSRRLGSCSTGGARGGQGGAFYKERGKPPSWRGGVPAHPFTGHMSPVTPTEANFLGSWGPRFPGAQLAQSLP